MKPVPGEPGTLNPDPRSDNPRPSKDSRQWRAGRDVEGIYNPDAYVGRSTYPPDSKYYHS